MEDNYPVKCPVTIDAAVTSWLFAEPWESLLNETVDSSNLNDLDESFRVGFSHRTKYFFDISLIIFRTLWNELRTKISGVLAREVSL